MEDPFARFEERRLKREAERLELKKRLAFLAEEGEKDAVAVERLKLVYPNGFPRGDDFNPDEGRTSPIPDELEPAPPPPATAAQAQLRAAELTVKEMALAILRDAGSGGLTAGQIKGKAFLRYKKHLNPNTLTVSLIRLKPKVRCEGRTWFYVREGFERITNGVAHGVPADRSDFEMVFNAGGAE